MIFNRISENLTHFLAFFKRYYLRNCRICSIPSLLLISDITWFGAISRGTSNWSWLSIIARLVLTRLRRACVSLRNKDKAPKYKPEV